MNGFAVRTRSQLGVALFWVLLHFQWTTGTASESTRLLVKYHRWSSRNEPKIRRQLLRPVFPVGRFWQRRLFTELHECTPEVITLPYLELELWELPAGCSRLVKHLHESQDIRVEPDVLVHASSQPKDPLFPLQWGMQDLKLPYLTNSTAQARERILHGSSKPVVMTIIDSGIDYTHPDLQGQLWTNTGEIPGNGIDDDGNGYVDDYYGYNFLSNSNWTMDDYFHGTHLAGIVGGVCDNNEGVCGMNAKVSIMACKFLDEMGSGLISNAIRCLDYSMQMGAQLTLNSYGGYPRDSMALRTAIDAAETKGQLFVTAAGNGNGLDIDYTPSYPGSSNQSNVVTVAAADELGRMCYFSNYGATRVHLAAPGVNILSTIPNAQYGSHDGTSQAAGVAAGALVLLMSAYQTAGFNITGRGQDVKSVLLGYGVKRLDNWSGYTATAGVLDIARALAAVPSSPAVVAAYVPGLTPLPVRSNLGDVTGSSTDGSTALGSAIVSTDASQLSRTSLALLKSTSNDYLACQATTLTSFPTPAHYGLDITEQLKNNGSWRLDLPLPVAAGSTPSSVVTIMPSGVMLLHSAGHDPSNWTAEHRDKFLADATMTLGDYFTLTIAGETNVDDDAVEGTAINDMLGLVLEEIEAAAVLVPFWGEVDLQQGGQVLIALRPDCAVVTLLDVSIMPSHQPISLQVQLWYQGEAYTPGSVSVTFLDMPPVAGLVGLFTGQDNIRSLHDTGICVSPPQLCTGQTNGPCREHDTELTVQYGNIVNFNVSNLGNKTLKMDVALEARGQNFLSPEVFLSAATAYRTTYASNTSACAEDTTTDSSLCVDFDPDSGVMAVSGVAIRPPRFAKPLRLPIHIKGLVQRDVVCSNHYVLLSTSPSQPQPGAANTIAFQFRCDSKTVTYGNSSVSSRSGCNEYGSDSFYLEVTTSGMSFSDDHCDALDLPASLDDAPMYYMFLGAQCQQEEGGCMDPVEWTRLEILSGLDERSFVSEHGQQFFAQYSGYKGWGVMELSNDKLTSQTNDGYGIRSVAGEEAEVVKAQGIGMAEPGLLDVPLAQMTSSTLEFTWRGASYTEDCGAEAVIKTNDPFSKVVRLPISCKPPNNRR